MKHKRVAESDGKEVPYEEIVKGYEYAPDQYVVLSRDELSELEPQRSRAIEIQDFVDLDEIDPIYFDHPYYLGPDKGAERAYALLVEAMEESHKVAIARFVLRNKEHLAAMRPMDGVMTMATMRFADEVVLAARDRRRGLRGGQAEEAREARARHGQAADRVADQRLRPRQVPRRVPRGAARPDRAQGRGRGGRRAPPSEEPKPTKAPDLMAALEESLAAVKGEEADTDGKASKPKAKSSSRSKSSSKSKSSSSNGRRKSSTSRKKAKA